MKKDLTIEQIRIDGETQPRVNLSSDTVAEYAEAWRVGIELPALVVFHDGSDYWLAEGFHRLFGAQQADLLTVPCDVRKGTLKDARTHAAGSNATHGLKRTNADKRKAVGMILEEHPEWSDRKIAEHCSVSHPIVSEARESQLEILPVDVPAKRVGKDGKLRALPTKPAPIIDDEPEEEAEVVEEIVHNLMKNYEPGMASLPPRRDHADALQESDALFHLKQWWKKSRKKDRTAFHVFVEDETAPIPPSPEKLRMHEATCELKKQVRKVLAKWPEEYRDSMGHQLKSLGEEILEMGELV